jgi:hypothetical protein
MRRLLPLAALLNMTLVFPDQAPSKFGVALRSGTARQLRKALVEGQVDWPADDQQAAELLVGLLADLGRHERLTRGHTERVRAYADLIGAEMGLDARQRELLHWGAMAHDLGKLTVPPEVLNKNGRPDDDEWALIREHPAAGDRMLEPLAGWLGEWRLAAGQHHERWDGKGYPAGLQGTEISLAGRIVAVADAYDVITSTRSYKKAMSPEAARREMVRCAGTQFDPDVVRALLQVSLSRDRAAAGVLGGLAELHGLSTLPQAAAQVASSASSAVAATATAAAVTVGAVGVGPIVDGSWAPSDGEQAAASEVPSADGDEGASERPENLALVDGSPPTTGSVTTVGSASSNPGPPGLAEGLGEPIDPAETEGPDPLVSGDDGSTTVWSGPEGANSSPDPAPIGVPAAAPAPTAAPPVTVATTIVAPTAGLPTVTVPTVPVPTVTAPTTVPTTMVPTTEPPDVATSTESAVTSSTGSGPTAVPDVASVEKSRVIRVDVLANDLPGTGSPTGEIDRDSLRIVEEPDHARFVDVTWIGERVWYAPASGFVGTDRLTYEVCDQADRCATAELVIEVTAPGANGNGGGDDDDD